MVVVARGAGGWKKEKGEGSLRFSLVKVREVRGGCLDLLVFQKGGGSVCFLRG